MIWPIKGEIFMRAFLLALCLVFVSAGNSANAGGFLSRILDPEADVKEQIDQARAEQEAKDRERQAREHEERERGAAEYRQREEQRIRAEQEARGKPLTPTQIANMCLQGGRIAYQAYSKGTFDAKYPDMPKLYYLIDYYGEQSPFPYSKQHAIGSVKHIAKRLQDSGLRRPDDGLVTVAAEEYARNVCEPLSRTPAEKAERDRWQAEAAKRGGLLNSPSDDRNN